MIPPMPSRTHRHESSHQNDRPDAGEPAPRRQDASWRRVPRAGGARQDALSHARRRKGIRRAKGKPQRAQARPVQQGCDRERWQIRVLLGEARQVLEGMK
ncbi:hypothetical protein [Bradyrhizobium sp. USDA 3364]